MPIADRYFVKSLVHLCHSQGRTYPEMVDLQCRECPAKPLCVTKKTGPGITCVGVLEEWLKSTEREQ